MLSAFGGLAARGWKRLFRQGAPEQPRVTVALRQMYRMPDEKAEKLGVKNPARRADDEEPE
jgi:hypothetical protein